MSRIFIILNVIIFISLVAKSEIIVQTRGGEFFELETAVEIIFMESQNERMSEPITLGATINNQSLAGKIFLFHNTLYGDQVVAEAQNNGALAIIEIASKYFDSGYMRYQFMDRTAVRSIRIPIFEITEAESAKLWPLLEADNIGNITIVPDNSINPWDVVLNSPGYWIFTAFLMAFSGTNLALAIWKLKLFIDYFGGIKASISQLALFMEIISNALRIVGQIDSFGRNNIFPELTKGVFHHISAPIAISSMMLFTLYWHEIMTRSSIVIHPFLVKTRLAFGSIVSICVISELVVILLRVFSAPTFYLITAYLYLALMVPLFAFYCMTGYMLVKRLRFSQQQGRKVKYLRATTFKIIGLGICIFFLVGIATIFSTPAFYYAPGYFVGWYSTYFTLDCISIINIIAFGIPSKGKSATNTSGKQSVTNLNKSQSSATDSRPQV
jgi:hypothetical protein